ncbi:ionotropic receptor 40a [Nilaparvata lugens]|uniref:ionotropic receptor 40a n=1 Tax=Nilaparvata lugens TaxID=108931 RepID=UPI00193E08CB|nr:ionotropic receptor 40a [Nilaparvata lugens]
MTTIHKLEDDDKKSKLQVDIKKHMTSHKRVVYLIIGRKKTLENVMNMIKKEDLIQRNILYIFLWNKFPPSRNFSAAIIEAVQVCVFVKTRAGNFNFYYNRKFPNGKGKLELVNWWSQRDKLFVHPLLPQTEDVYRDFHKRRFKIPVVNKPPWYFVSYSDNNVIQSVRGRDKKLLDLISQKLNFKLVHFDPPDHSQGSAIVNGSMQGVLGTIWKREVEMFIGDLTVTYERSQAVDFTFPTLVDNEVFLTHAPGYLSEAVALIRPFHWKVWPPVIVTFLVSGPVLFFFMRNARVGKRKERIVKKDRGKLLCDCIWLTSAIFLKQSCLVRTNSTQVRFVVLTLYLGATYVIGDMYSANLTSMLARPARETPISSLEQLAGAMEKKGIQLLAELHSASHGNLENGTGLYRRIWNTMKRQPKYLITTAERGIELVKDNKHFALIGGRETFYYNTRRYGAHFFHLSEKLHTRYSAIALQVGCPFIQNFNRVLMQLFEAGILAKITEDEYQKLIEDKNANDNKKVETVAEGRKAKEEEQDGSQPRAMSMDTLSGAFLVLFIGYCASALLLLMEIAYFKSKRKKIQSIVERGRNGRANSRAMIHTKYNYCD